MDSEERLAVDDATAAARFREGDREALGVLYARYLGAVYDFLARLVREPATAEDLAQSTFLQAFERRATLREPERVRAWLFSVAYHLAMNHLTRSPQGEPVEEHLELAAVEPGPPEEAEAAEAVALVWDAAASLQPRQYAVLDLTVRRGLSTAEVAAALGLPVRHAAVLVHRAREALGNAVRDLLVARRRQDCPQLAGLVPELPGALTPAVRETVDHHLRRCDRCRGLAAQLTAPAEVLGVLSPLPVPARLLREGWSRLQAGSTSAPHGAACAGRLSIARHSRRFRLAVASTAVALALAAGLALALGRGGGQRPPIVAVTVLPTTAARRPAPRGHARVIPARTPARPLRRTRAPTRSPRSPHTPRPTREPTPTRPPERTPTPSPQPTPSPTPTLTRPPEPTLTPTATPTHPPEPTPTPTPMLCRLLPCPPLL